MFARLGVIGPLLGLIAATQCALQVHAQCTTIDFDNLVPGTVVTNQYPGVTFSGQNTDGTASFDPVIYDPNGPTASEPQCLSAQGVGGFSQEFIRVDFERDQTEVSFVLGVRYTGGACHADDTVAVRYYSFANNAYTLAGSFLPVVNGLLSSDRVYVFVHVTRPNNQLFRRIEIEGDAAHGCGARFELIDDLSFDVDTTPPTALFDALPTCICNGSSVTGSAYDADGGIAGWQLHRRQLHTPGAGWVLIRSSSTEVISGELGPWNTSGPDGDYSLRLRVTNQCGLLTEAFTDVYMDKAFNALTLRYPTNGALVGGSVCFDGTVSDHCGGNFTIEKRPVGGAFAPVNSINPPWVTNDPLGSWNTLAGVPDGNYEVRVTGTDDCGNIALSPILSVVVDNTLPIAAITSPVNCAAANGMLDIAGVVNDLHLANWALSYTGGAANGWVAIQNGGTNVNGHLAYWDMTNLPPCCYTLRLTATDKASIDCGGKIHQTDFLVSVDIGVDCPADLNHNQIVNLPDLAELLGKYGTQCP